MDCALSSDDECARTTRFKFSSSAAAGVQYTRHPVLCCCIVVSCDVSTLCSAALSLTLSPPPPYHRATVDRSLHGAQCKLLTTPTPTLTPSPPPPPLTLLADVRRSLHVVRTRRCYRLINFSSPSILFVDQTV